jgi:predicted Zn-dependent protease
LPKAKVYVSLNQGLNAFALPDGSLVVNQGLINALETKDQLFAILVHEFSHFEDNFLNWNDMLSELTSGRAQEYKADRTSLLRLGRLGYQPKAFQGAAEIIGSYWIIEPPKIFLG